MLFTRATGDDGDDGSRFPLIYISSFPNTPSGSHWALSCLSRFNLASPLYLCKTKRLASVPKIDYRSYMHRGTRLTA